MYKVYQFTEGDNLANVARKFGTTEENLKKINGIVGDNTTIRPGSFVIVPINNMNTSFLTTYMVKKGDNMYAIAKEFGVDEDTLLSVNGLEKDDYIYPNQEILVPSNNTKLYITKDGDTLKSITRNLGVSINQIYTPTGEIYIKQDQLLMYK